MPYRFPLASVIACGILFWTAGCSQTALSQPPSAVSAHADLATSGVINDFISAKDPRFCYDGRVDLSLKAGVGLIWQATCASIEIEGNHLALEFAQAEGANFFDVRVDGQSATIEVPAGADTLIDFPLPFSYGRHHVTLFKRSEARAGVVVFAGLRLAKGSQAWAVLPPQPVLKFEFLGDSITAGACSEDGLIDQWASRRTHNSAVSYAAVTASAFGASYLNISVSGMGMVAGYVDVRAPQLWDRLYPSAKSPRADLTKWIPDVVFVNFGENDTSFTHNNGLPFPTSFVETYVAFVRAIRSTYPRAEIVLLRGGMGGCANDLTLRAAWDSIAAQLESEDPKVAHFAFSHFSNMHPRVADHQALANELITWLQKQKFVPALN